MVKELTLLLVATFLSFFLLALANDAETCLDQNCAADDSASTISYPLSYSIGFKENFISRGFLQISTSNVDKKLKLKLSDKTFKLDVTEDLKAAILDNLPLRVKIALKDGDDGMLLSSFGMCDLGKTGFRELMTFNLFKHNVEEVNSFEIIGFSLSGPPIPPNLEAFKLYKSQERSCKEIVEKIEKDNVKEIIVKSKAKVILPKENVYTTIKQDEGEVDAAVPEMTKDVREGELFESEIKKQKKEKEQGEDSQSFLRKYWYVFLPMFLMSVFGGPPEPPAQATQTGQTVQAPKGGAGKNAGGRKKK